MLTTAIITLSTIYQADFPAENYVLYAVQHCILNTLYNIIVLTVSGISTALIAEIRATYKRMT